MKKLVLPLIVSFLVIALSFGFYLYLQNTRYDIRSVGQGRAYKIDRKTGQIWMILGRREVLVESSDTATQQKSPEDKAIELVKESYALGNYPKVETQIRNWLKEKKGSLRIIGWKARKIDDQAYLVSYTINEGSGEQGYFFDVNLVAEIVCSVNGNPELAKKYGIGEKKVYSEKEIEDFMRKIFKTRKAPLPWREVIQKEDYKALSSEQRLRAREQYFNEVVIPQIKKPEDIEKARSQFYDFANSLEPELKPEKEGFRKKGFEETLAQIRLEVEMKEGIDKPKPSKVNNHLGRVLEKGISGAVLGGLFALLIVIFLSTKKAIIRLKRR